MTASSSGVIAMIRLDLAPGADEPTVARAAHAVLRELDVALDPHRVELVRDTPRGRSASPHLRLLPGQPRLSPDDVADLLARLEAEGDGRYAEEVLDAVERHPSAAAPPDAGAEAFTVGSRRLAFAGVAVATRGRRARATVVLEADGVECTGVAQGTASLAELPRIVARATVLAIGSAVGHRAVLDVVDVVIVPMAADQVCVVQVRSTSTDGSERLTGAVQVRDDPHEAVIRATLDAVNRRLAPELAR